MIDIRRLIKEYDENRFLEAYEWVRPLWPKLPEVKELSLKEIIHGGRLAFRVGGFHYRNWLFDLAFQKAPHDPLVKYFARFTQRRKWHILEQVQDYEKNPRLKTEAPELQASWLGSQASFFASIRNFTKAQQLIDEAMECGAERAWVHCCAADVHLAQDKRQEALEAAEAAWEISPGMPAAASLLGRTLSQNNKVQEAATRLMEFAAKNKQSFEVALVALWFHLAHAEAQPPKERQRLNESATDLAASLSDLAPLADGVTKFRLNRAKLDCAFHAGDDETIAKLAKEMKSPFYRAITKNIEQQNEGGRRVLDYRPVFQKRNACVPASVASVLGTFDIHLNEDELADELTYRGTELWRAIEWLKERGFVVRPFIASPELVCKLIDNGVSFVYTLTGLTESHAVAAIGVDKNARTLIWHDPNSERWGQILLDHLAEGEAPVGPLAFAVVPPEKEELLRCIDNEAIHAHDVLLSYDQAIEKSLDKANEILNEFEEKYRESDVAKRLRARHYMLQGDKHNAIKLLEELLTIYPSCLRLRAELLNCLHSTRNTARIRQVLKDIVENKRMPGICKSETWRYAPTTYIAQYADYMGVNADSYAKAEALLQKALERTPFDATAHHVLGDIYCRQGLFDRALTPFKLAAFLAETDEHYAQSFCNVLRQLGREKEGLDFLRARIEQLGAKLHGGNVYSTLVSTLEDYGYPEDAIKTLNDGLEKRPDDSSLSAFATSFWIRMGQWEKAEANLDVVKKEGSRASYLRTAVYFYHRSGQWQRALPLSRELLSESPDDMQNCRFYLLLLEQAKGSKAVLAQAKKWLNENLGHDDYEEIYYERLRDLGHYQEAQEIILSRSQRNPMDLWAWRELGHILLAQSGSDLPQLKEELDKVLEQCILLASDTPSTLLLQARVCHWLGELKKALELHFAALEQLPSFLPSYEGIHSLIPDLEKEEQKAVYDRLEELLLRSTERLNVARTLTFSKATTLGFTEALETVERLRSKRPDSPELIEAWADLHLHFGRGRTAAREVADFLEDALQRFPNHFDLRFSLAHAYSLAADPGKELEAFEEILRRQPLNNQARIFVAQSVTKRGEFEAGCALLKKGVEISPLDCHQWNALANLYWEEGLFTESLNTYAQARKHNPLNVELIEVLVSRLGFLGAHDEAIIIIEEALSAQPRLAYLYYLQADTLRQSENHYKVSVVEKALRHALELDCDLFAAADLLAILLTEQHRFTEARKVMNDFRVWADDGPRLARLAWIEREEGNKAQAVKQMLETVSVSPLSRWAWMRLMDWLEEDKSWIEAKEAVRNMPSAFENDPAMRSRRLELLERAATPIGEIDKEWQRLLEDFPEHETLSLRRFDMLLEREEYALAKRVLKKAEEFHPRSTYLLARKVLVLTKLKDIEEALNEALHLWSLAGDDGGWPEYTSWKALSESNLTLRAAKRAYKHILAGNFIRLQAFDYVINSLVHTWAQEKGLASQRESLNKLLKVLEEADWELGEHRAIVLKAYNRQNLFEPVFNYWRKNETQCRENLHLWQAYSYILGNAPQDSESLVRSWMYDWRSVEGVEMWSLTNYLMSMRFDKYNQDTLVEIHDLSLHCLRNLKHDDSTRLHAANLCEATLRLHRDEEFLDHVDTYEKILTEDNEGDFYPQDYKWLPPMLFLFRNLLLSTSSEDAWKWSYALRDLLEKDTEAWVRDEWDRLLSPKMHFFKRKLAMGMMTLQQIGKNL